MEDQNKRAGAAATAPSPTGTEVPATHQGQDQGSRQRRPGATAPMPWDIRACLRNALSGPLNRTEAFVLMALMARTNPFGIAWPSVATLCAMTGASDRNARKAIACLQDRGLLAVERLHTGPCDAQCSHSGRADRYPNGKPLGNRQALLFHVLHGRALRVLPEVGGPGCGNRTDRAVGTGRDRAVGTGRDRAVGTGRDRAVGTGRTGLWEPVTSLGTKSGKEISTSRKTQGTGTSARALTGPRGLRAPAHEPTAPGGASHPAGDPEGMVVAPAGATERVDFGDRAETTTTSPQRKRAAAHACGARMPAGPADPDRLAPQPPPPSTQRPKGRESTSRAARAVVAYWAQRFGARPKALHTTARLDIVRAWLRLGFTPTELGAAVHAASVNEWYRSGARSGLAFVLRSEDAIRALAMAGKDAGFRGLPRPRTAAGASAGRPSGPRANSGPAIGRELSITPVNESLHHLANIASRLGATTQKGVDHDAET